jgi:hypothetical protein
MVVEGRSISDQVPESRESRSGQSRREIPRGRRLCLLPRCQRRRPRERFPATHRYVNKFAIREAVGLALPRHMSLLNFCQSDHIGVDPTHTSSYLLDGQSPSYASFGVIDLLERARGTPPLGEPHLFAARALRGSL